MARRKRKPIDYVGLKVTTKNQKEFRTLSAKFVAEKRKAEKQGYVFPEGFEIPTRPKRITKEYLKNYREDLRNIKKFAPIRKWTDEMGNEHVEVRKKAFKSMAFEVPKQTPKYNAVHESTLMYDSVIAFLNNTGHTDFGLTMLDILEKDIPQDGISKSDINIAISRLAGRDIVLQVNMLYEDGKSDLEYYLKELIKELPVSENIKQDAYNRIPDTFNMGED